MSPRRALVVACATVVLAVSVAPVAASAAAPRGFFGVQAWQVPFDADFARMGAGKVGTFRFNLEWSVVERERGTYDWSRYDRIVAHLALQRIRPLPVLYGSPSFAARRQTYPPRSRSARRSFARFVRAVVGRYGRGGEFWREHQELPYRPVTHWQPWNEVNLRVYWWKRPSARQYASLLKLVRREARRSDRRARIVLAGLPESRGGISMIRYLTQLYRVRGAKRLFDVVAIHPYARNHRGVKGAVVRARRVMNRYRDRRKQIWLTELGWATAGPRSQFKTSERGQASRLRASFRLGLELRRRYRVGALVWFSWRDRALVPGERDWWAPHTGLLDKGGSPKPAWRTFTSFTGGSSG